MAGAEELERAVGGELRLDAVDRVRELRPRLQHVELGGRLDRPVQLYRAAPEGVGQGKQDPPDLLLLLLFDRDDVVVDLDGAERLEEETGAARRGAVHDAGNRRAVLGPHDQHEAAVALGDDLILQVLRRLAAAQVRLERAAQPRSLLAQAVAQRPERRAGIVDDVARRVDGLADPGRLGPERRGRRRRLVEEREPARPANGVPRVLDRIEEAGQPQKAPGLERAAFDRQRVERPRQVGRRLEGEGAVGGEELRRLGGAGEQVRHAAGIGRRCEAGEPIRPHGGDGKIAHRLDDPVELEGLQGAGLRWRSQGFGHCGLRGQPLMIAYETALGSGLSSALGSWPGTLFRCTRAESPRAEGPEPRAESPEPRAPSREPRAQSLQVVNEARQGRGAETVVDVDDGDARRAAVQHPEQRRDAAEAGAVPHARGDGDDRPAH